MCLAVPRVSQMKTKLVTSSVAFNPEKRGLGLTLTSHSVREEKSSRALPRIRIQPEERTLSLILGAHPALRKKLQDQASPQSSQHRSSMRIPAFIESSSAPGYPIFQTTPLFQWRQLRMAADITACQSQQSSAAI